MRKINSPKYKTSLDQLYFSYTDIIIEGFEDHLKVYLEESTRSEDVYFYRYISDLYQSAMGSNSIQLKHDGDNFHYHVTKLYNALLGYSSTNEEEIYE